MKNYVIIGLSFCLSVLFFCTGCNPKATVTKNAITFDSISVTETYHMFNDEKQPACDLGILFVFPADYTDKEVLKSLQQLFITEYFGPQYAGLTPQDAVEEYTEQYLANYKSLETEYTKDKESRAYEEDEGIPSYSYYEHSKSYIPFNEGNILSFIIRFFDYTGGAHGSTSIKAFIADVATGKLLQSNDIFTEDSHDKITELVIQQLMTDFEVTKQEDLNNVGFFDASSIVANENFYADDKGITFIYNQYEIAPYVMGIIEVFLPYDKIGPYINKNCPLHRFV